MNIPGAHKIKNLFLAARARFPQNEAIILAYHRIFAPKTDPQLLCTSPRNFEEHLKIISQHYNPISLQALGKATKVNKVPNKSIVITFDDGYVDNLLYAKPLLEKYRIPATIFVSTHYVNKKKEFWWDELERIILLAPALPEKLSLSINKKEYTWLLTNQKKHNQHLQKWDVLQKPKNDSHRLYLDLHTLLKPLSFEKKEIILQKLASWARVQNKARHNYHVASHEELIKLSRSPFIEIGSHTVTHSNLAAQTQEKQSYEITQSKKYLENIIKKPVNSFSYPFGTHNDIGTKLPSMVKKTGYALATANYPNLVTKRTDPFLLPRYLVRNWDGKTFYKQVEKWFNGE
ncbi:polysaccharide deacetylase family protein [Candidatus Dependentiae bacterium]|nr:polysaccharide deacetylase family protein [Candidatus Dependentiae bacterium]